MAPDFGSGVRRLRECPGPRDLFCRLLDVEDNVHYLEPAFRFAEHAFDRAAAVGPSLRNTSDADFVQQLLAWAHESLPSAAERSALAGASPSWPSRMVVEFAPAGLSDGAWLHGAVQLNAVENEVGMLMLQQLMIRLGGPLASESYVQRYASLLRSLGTAPAAITRWEPAESPPCVPISYEHALLGLSLAYFQSALAPEILGFNLWMAAIGPCPLLESIAGRLRDDGRAALTYLEAHDRESMHALAESAVRRGIEEQGSEALRARVARGFAAAHQSYLRWECAMRGRNVPMTPADCVLDIIRRKAAFTTGHHAGVMLGGRALESYFAGDYADHEALLARLAASEFIRPGEPDNSPLIAYAIAFGGPMFDVFTASEQDDLRQWIASIGSSRAGLSPGPPIDLAGRYTAPQDPESVRRQAVEQGGVMPMPELLYRFANADRFPLMRVFGRFLADQALATLASVFDGDARLDSVDHPSYTERTVAEMVAANHARNVGVRAARQRDEVIEERTEPGLIFLFDGCWLQQFADVARIGHEEYGWLFRIYASELGDGTLAWSHNVIARKMLAGKYPQVVRRPDDRALYDVLPVTFADLIVFSMALNTRRFLPEMLGLNLSIEATGVGGIYLTWAQNAERRGNQWEALYFRLHNSIDNYASGHTKWSLAAVQAFMARTREAAPSAVDGHWRRVWRIWRFFEIREHGTDLQKRILNESLGAGSFVPSVP